MNGIFSTKKRKAVRYHDEDDPNVLYYMDGYAVFTEQPNNRVYDYEVADYVKKHMRFIDRLSMRKVSSAMAYAFAILSKSTEEPKELKNNKWKFRRN